MASSPATRKSSRDRDMTSPYSAAALKRSAVHALAGKGISALLTFSILLLVVRLLPVAQYGAYVSLVAALEAALAVSSIGLPWMTARYLPEYSLHADGAVLHGSVVRVMSCFAASIAAVALALGLFTRVARFVGVVGLNAGWLYILVMLAKWYRAQCWENVLGHVATRLGANQPGNKEHCLSINAWMARRKK